MNAQEHLDKTALSYWFPKIEAAGVPVPKTVFVAMSSDAHMCVAQTLWGEEPSEERRNAYHGFLRELEQAARAMGSPCFLRTDHTSNKHSWKDACFLSDPIEIDRHVFEIAEFSECCDLIGLPYSTWVVREFLPTTPMGICPRYGDMPICREFRFFVDEGKVRCHHPYWPLHALRAGAAPALLDYDALCNMDADEPALIALAERAGRAVGESWSIDILETTRGWYVTDMAEAHKSFHWEDCALSLQDHEK